MHVLLLDNYDSFTYNLAQILEESKICTFDIIKNNEITSSEINKFDKILLSPGPGIPSEAGKMLEIIKKFSDKKSILGVCLGMQGITEVFGASLFNLNEVFHGIKEKVNIISNSILFNNLEKEQFVGLYHSWAVSNKNFPEKLKITAISENGIIMAIEHKSFPVFGVQFHPESYITENGKIIIENWLKL